MSVLETVAEKHLGEGTLRKHPKLRAALKRIKGSAALEAERERTASIVELCFEFDRETDAAEKENILRTIEEISANNPLELPTEDIGQWEQKLKATDAGFAKADAAATKETGAFLKTYFSLRAKAGSSSQPVKPRAKPPTRSS